MRVVDGLHSSDWLDALHLASPLLPIGGFAYSQGLEMAQELGLVHDRASASVWIRDGLLLVMARQEMPWWLACYRAAREGHWSALTQSTKNLVALRETAELRLESRQMAYSLVRLFDQWLQPEQRPPTEVLDSLRGNFTAAHAALCGMRALASEVAMTAYLWAWLENQVLSAVKLIPLGQADGQVLLHEIKPCVPQAIAVAVSLPTQEVGSAPIGWSVISARHETQYTRLFRS
jgi:urease accessory protein